jgi:hypothetical protein
MPFNKRVSLLVSLAAMAAMGSALPAQANVGEVESIEDALLTAEAVEVELSNTSEQGTELVNDAASVETELQPAPESIVPFENLEETNLQEVSQPETSASLLMAPQVSNLMSLDDNSLLSFDASGIDTAIESATVDVAQVGAEGSTDLAQLTRGSYNGVAPIYIGAGGNIGIGDRDATGVASFGFSVISKISLGPRFALRPAALITNQSTSFTVPLTYNFNTLEAGGFRFQPYVGAGVDIPTGASVGLLLDAGVDVPISRDFTINAVTNWRVTSGFGLGINIGVGYNFPFIFD